tara:strand:- start:181 stop:1122 length:942 start_codon:yes stop_codon:yes gene_type:complete
MPQVTQEFPVRISNDPAEQNIPQGRRAMYLDMLLSEYYGKMIRQGQSFKIQGIQASLRPDPESAGIDIGLSAEVTIDYVPTTKHSRFAWNQVYNGWRQQKKLQQAVGTQIRYDDLEFGWDADEGVDRARTSIIYGSGLDDTSQEKLVLVGTSQQTAGTTIGQYSLKDYYNSSYQTPDPSRNPFTNTDIKEAKWGATPFPETQTLHCTATSSAQWFEGASGLNIHQGAITMGDIQELSVPVQSLCGVLQVGAYTMPDDTAGQVEDDFILTVTVFVSSWKPLVFKKKSRSKWSRRSKGGRRYSSKRTYRKYRRRR